MPGNNSEILLNTSITCNVISCQYRNTSKHMRQTNVKQRSINTIKPESQKSHLFVVLVLRNVQRIRRALKSSESQQPQSSVHEWLKRWEIKSPPVRHYHTLLRGGRIDECEFYSLALQAKWGSLIGGFSVVRSVVIATYIHDGGLDFWVLEGHCNFWICHDLRDNFFGS